MPKNAPEVFIFRGNSYLKPSILHLGHNLNILRPTLHNGPGWRIGIWVQGCSLRCTKNCLNPHLLGKEGGFQYTVEELLETIASVVQEFPHKVEGVTILGGEPTEQAKALRILLQEAQTIGLSTMLYTGYTLEALHRNSEPDILSLLSVTDLLVDGPFRDELYDKKLAWRGSRNQQIHLLSSRYSQEDLDAAYQHQKKGFSIMVRPNGEFSASGFQSRTDAAAIERLLYQIDKSVRK